MLSLLNISSGCFLESQLCYFDKSLTFGSTLFILFTLLFTLVTLLILFRYVTFPLKKFGIMFFGVLMFELFTAPMWTSLHLGKFGYYYLDLSWIPTLCWTSMFILNVHLIDHFFPKYREGKRFFLSLIIPLIFTIIGELLMIKIGIRSYAPEILKISIFQIFGLPIEVLYYAPVFSSFIIAFYKFWMFQLNKIPLVPMRKKVTVRNFVICFIGIFMFELLIEPLIDNRNFPSWSYLYQDISFIRILMWVALITAGTTIVDKLFIGAKQLTKFLIYIPLISLVFFQMESWLIQNGYRVYLESAKANFSGFKTPVSNIPIEIAFAIPLYIVLIIAFVRYWRLVWDNQL